MALAGTTYRRSVGILTADQGDAIVLLLRRPERFYTLGGAAAVVWRRLGAECGVASLAAYVTEAFDVDTERARQDVAAVLEKLRTLGAVEETVCARNIVRPRYLETAWRLIMWRAQVRLSGLRSAVIRANARARAGTSALVPPPDVAKAIARDVAQVAALVPGRVRCLEQSLATSSILAVRGIQSVVRVGVQARPFRAHAWVEVGGVPVNADPEDLNAMVQLRLGGEDA